jgi:DNA sulfur modification protein DndD
LWISKIELTNFKSYSHAEFDFPEPTNGENIVLIGGMNGYGKTSVLEALYLCLYGKDAIIHLARAGLKMDDARGYPTFLEKAFNGEAKRDGQNSMSVRLVFNKSRAKAFEINRRWYFRTNSGIWTNEEEALVYDVIRNVRGSPRRDGANGFQLAELLDDNFVPAHIAPFFFFDGEEVKKLADQQRIEQVKVGLEGLLGVVLLRQLAERLRTFENGKRSDVSNVDESNISRLLESLTSDEGKLAAVRAELTSHGERLNMLKAERESLFQRITSAGGGRGDIATVKDLAEERQGLRSQMADAQKQLERILADKLPFHLMPKQLLTDFKAQLKGEIALAEWQAECRTLQPKRDKFEQSFLGDSGPSITPELTAEQLVVVKSRIETAWASLFHPAPTNCAEEVVHGYLHDGLREKALSFLGTIQVGQQEVHDLLARQKSLEEQIGELNRKIARVEGIDRDGTLNELTANLNRIGSEMDILEQAIKDKEREEYSLEVTVSNTKASYSHEKSRLDETSPVRSLLGKSERVRAVIEEVVPLLFPLKVKALATAMTKVYKQLAHKDQVAKIEIDDDGTTRILGKSGKEMTFDRSAGENQIFATALIAGLAEVSEINAPLVVDTPLGRLDSAHRENIFKFWVGTPNRQVILLSQDKEIDGDFYARIEKHVCATYLLKHSDVGDGIGRTVVVAGEYFGVEV